MPYSLSVNGRTTSVDVPADMPLLWVLRDVLNQPLRINQAPPIQVAKQGFSWA